MLEYIRDSSPFLYPVSFSLKAYIWLCITYSCKSVASYQLLHHSVIKINNEQQKASGGGLPWHAAYMPWSKLSYPHRAHSSDCDEAGMEDSADEEEDEEEEEETATGADSSSG